MTKRLDGYRGSDTHQALKPPNNTLATTPLKCRRCIFRRHCETNAHTCTTLKPSALALQAQAKLDNHARLAVDGKLLVPDEGAPPLPCPAPDL